MTFDVPGAVQAGAELGKELAAQVGEGVNHTEHNKAVLADNEGEREITKGKMQLVMAQIKTNLAEIGSTSLFKSGWRPALGWVGSVSVAMYFIPQFLVGAVAWAVACFYAITEAVAAGTMDAMVLPPWPLDPQGLFELIFGMLGIGGLRTFEKVKGVDRSVKSLSKKERRKIIESAAPELWAKKFGGGQSE